MFPSEEESDSEGDEDTTKQLHSPVGTESEDLHDVACKGQKRKLSEHDGSFLFLHTLLFHSAQQQYLRVFGDVKTTFKLKVT